MSIHSDLRDCLLPLVTEDVYYAVMPDGVIPTTAKAPGGLYWDDDARWDERVRWDGATARVNWSAIVIAADIATTDVTACGTDDPQTHRFQIDVYTATYVDSLTMRAAVFGAIDAQFCSAVRLTDMADFDADLKLHRRIIEYQIPE